MARFGYLTRSDDELVEWQRELEKLYRQSGYFDDAVRLQAIADALEAGRHEQVRFALRQLMRVAVAITLLCLLALVNACSSTSENMTWDTIAPDSAAPESAVVDDATPDVAPLVADSGTPDAVPSADAAPDECTEVAPAPAEACKPYSPFASHWLGCEADPMPPAECEWIAPKEWCCW